MLHVIVILNSLFLTLHLKHYSYSPHIPLLFFWNDILLHDNSQEECELLTQLNKYHLNLTSMIDWTVQAIFFEESFWKIEHKLLYIGKKETVLVSFLFLQIEFGLKSQSLQHCSIRFSLFGLHSFSYNICAFPVF